MTRTSYLVLALLVVDRSVLAGEPADDDEDGEPSPATSEASPPAPSPAVPFNKKWLGPYFASRPAAKAAARFRSGDFPGAAQDLGRLLAGLAKNAPERNPLRLLYALALMNQSSWEAAGDVFEDLWSDYPLLGSYHAYYAARCRLRQGDPESAFVWLGRVPSGSVIEPDAAMVKVDALVAAKRWAEVETEVSTFLARFRKGPRRTEAMFLHAEAQEELGRPLAQVAAAYRKVWAESPLEAWAARADERLQALAKRADAKEAAAITARSLDEQLSRGMILFGGNQNAAAEAAFAAALAMPEADPATTCKLRFHLAQSVWKQRQRQRAAPLFDVAIADCRKAGEDDLTARALYQGARSYATAGDKEKAVALYAQIEKDFAGHRLADDARLRAAEVLTDTEKDEDAEKLLGDMADIYPKGDMAPEGLWRLAFASWRAGDHDKTLHWLDETLRRYPREDIWYAEGRAYYWKARVFEKKGDTRKARATYEHAVREYPLSAYALFSLERMRRAFPEARTALLRELRKHMGDLDKHSPWEFGKRTIFGEPGLVRAVEFARMGLGGEARRELAKLGLRVGGRREGDPDASREDIYWITAILLDRGGVWHASHSIPRHRLASFRRHYPNGGRYEAEWRLGYPKAFPELVAKHSRANHVPEALQWAIMREESSFYPRAESFANALGLTQMMSRTARRFAKWPVTRDALFDPDKNLEVGSKFLAFLLEHYGGAVPLVISGYNAGEGGVDRWLRERGDLELDEFIETIPYDETRGYTKRVLSSYLTYTWLYQPDKPVPRLSFALQPPVPAGKVGKNPRDDGKRSRKIGKNGGKNAKGPSGKKQ